MTLDKSLAEHCHLSLSLLCGPSPEKSPLLLTACSTHAQNLQHTLQSLGSKIPFLVYEDSLQFKQPFGK